MAQECAGFFLINQRRTNKRQTSKEQHGGKEQDEGNEITYKHKGKNRHIANTFCEFETGDRVPGLYT